TGSRSHAIALLLQGRSLSKQAQCHIFGHRLRTNYMARSKTGFSRSRFKAALKGRLSGGIAARGGKLPVEAVAQSLGVSKAQLAETAGVSIDTLYRTDRAGSAKTQARL